MTVDELCTLEDELQFLLRTQGPVQFIRGLVLQADGAQLLAHDTRPAGEARLATRFRYVDSEGGEAFLTVFTESRPGSPPDYALECVARSRSPARA